MQKNQNFLAFLFKEIKIVSITNDGYFFLNLFLINLKDFLWISVSIILLKNFFLLLIFAAPQSWWLITISFLILCNFIEILMLSQKDLCHFLNLLAETPIADPEAPECLLSVRREPAEVANLVLRTQKFILPLRRFQSYRACTVEFMLRYRCEHHTPWDAIPNTTPRAPLF